MTSEELKSSALDAFFKIADRFGVPCVVLAVFLYFAHGAAVTVHETIVEPVVHGHLEYLESTASTLKEIGQTQKQQADTMSQLYRGQAELNEVVQDILTSGSKATTN